MTTIPFWPSNWIYFPGYMPTCARCPCHEQPTSRGSSNYARQLFNLRIHVRLKSMGYDL